MASWIPLPMGTFKFNVDRAARGKSWPAGIGGVLRNFNGEIMLLFSKNAGVKKSNEPEALAILKALQLFSRSFRVK